MRIAHISDCYAPRTGGIETQVRSLARAQASRGDEVHVITATPGHGDVRSGSDVDGEVDLHRVAARLPAEIPIHPRTGHHVRSILEALNPDVIHLHTGVISPFAWGGLRVAAGLGVPRVVTVHSMWGPLARPGHRLAWRVLPWLTEGTVVTAVSHTAAEAIQSSLGIDVGVIPNGIDPQQWPATMATGEPGVVRIVSVARLAPRKRISALLDVLFRASLRLDPDVEVRATIIGDGPERARAQRRIDAAGMSPRVSLVGRYTPEQIRSTYIEADLFAQASVRESFGIAALEARTSGLPVIARSQTGAGEFIDDGVNGLLCADDDGLVDAIAALGVDPQRREAMRRFNVDHPPDQSWPRVLEVADEVYAQAGA